MNNEFALIRPVAIADTGSFTRASTGTYFDSAGVMQTAAIDEPRFTHDPVTLEPLGLLDEDESANKVRNNTMVGAAVGIVGAGGAVPTNWNATVSGMTTEVLASAVWRGINYIRLRVSGTAAASFWSLNCESSTQFPTGVGQTWSRSDYLALVAGSLANATGVTQTMRQLAGDGATNLGDLTVPDRKASLTSTLQRFTVTATTENASIAYLQSFLRVGLTIGQAYDFTIDVGMPQLELGSFATSVIPTAAAAVTRAADINTAKLVSNVAEPAVGAGADPAAWNAATAYLEGDRASRLSLHKIYQRVVAGTTATAPESDAVNWVEVGPTNRWKMFDASVESQTEAAESIVVVLTPGVLADQLALLNLDANSVRVQVAGTTYDQTIDLKSRVVRNWFDYFFEPFVYTTEVVFTGLPLRMGNVITITISKPASTAKVGACVLGLSKVIGGAEFGASAGITDYSIKEADAFGNTTVVERAYSKRMNVSLRVAASKVDEVHRLLADYRARPLVWVGAGNLYGALIVYGYFRSFQIVIAYPTESICALEIEGLT
jgi:hypothetical protein